MKGAADEGRAPIRPSTTLGFRRCAEIPPRTTAGSKACKQARTASSKAHRGEGSRRLDRWPALQELSDHLPGGRT